MARLSPRPATFISASAIGIYGSQGDRILGEDSPPGSGFLSDVCVVWERTAGVANALGIRRRKPAHRASCSATAGRWPGCFRPSGGGGRPPGLRPAVDVLDHIHDWAGSDRVCPPREAALHGPLNATAPKPRDECRIHPHAGLDSPPPRLRRRAGLRPEAALRRDGGVLLSSQRVLPKAAQAAGFQFLYPDLGPALHHLPGASWVPRPSLPLCYTAFDPSGSLCDISCVFALLPMLALGAGGKKSQDSQAPRVEVVEFAVKRTLDRTIEIDGRIRKLRSELPFTSSSCASRSSPRTTTSSPPNWEPSPRTFSRPATKPSSTGRCGTRPRRCPAHRSGGPLRKRDRRRQARALHHRVVPAAPDSFQRPPPSPGRPRPHLFTILLHLEHAPRHLKLQEVLTRGGGAYVPPGTGAVAGQLPRRACGTGLPGSRTQCGRSLGQVDPQRARVDRLNGAKRRGDPSSRVASLASLGLQQRDPHSAPWTCISAACARSSAPTEIATSRPSSASAIASSSFRESRPFSLFGNAAAVA